jgi:hypothetical protein
LPKISEFVSPKQRQRFIRRIFRKDEAYYGGVLATLNGMGSWEEAASYLQHIFDVNELDPYDRDVVAFTDAVQKRYSSAAGGGGTPNSRRRPTRLRDNTSRGERGRNATSSWN